MPELMLRPDWPGGRFQRSIVHRKGKKTEAGRVLVFTSGVAVDVTDDEFKALAADIGKALFEIERDPKNRPRFVETVPIETPPAKE